MGNIAPEGPVVLAIDPIVAFGPSWVRDGNDPLGITSVGVIVAFIGDVMLRRDPSPPAAV